LRLFQKQADNNLIQLKPFIMTNVTTTNWAAWVNLMPPRPTPGGTLHVTGDVDTHSTDFAYLEKANPQGINPKILLLNLIVETGIVPATNPQKVHYTEGLRQKDQYSRVEIFYKGERIVMIDEIKEVH
jgi:hypothetical protein